MLQNMSADAEDILFIHLFHYSLQSILIKNSPAYTNNGGTYSHDFVDYNGTVITSPYIETVSGSASSVQLSIADADGVFTKLDIVDGDGCRYVRFKVNSVPTTGANGVISIKDSSGVIMWNWHIWVWEDDLTPVTITNNAGYDYNILPVNLASTWDDGTKAHIKNWFYQWGRPTPLLGASSYNSETDAASYGAMSFNTVETASNFQQGIQNPTTFYYNDNGYLNWFGNSFYGNLWNASFTSKGWNNTVTKTVYDPCPTGTFIPRGGTFTYFSLDTAVERWNDGWRFKRNSSDTIGVFFPATGVRLYSTGKLYYVNNYSDVWLSAVMGPNSAYILHATSSDVNPIGSESWCAGLSVRPAQEQ